MPEADKERNEKGRSEKGSSPGEETGAHVGIDALLLTWYAKAKRDLPWRKTHDPYAIWVSEVMLQQTQVKTVIPYYHRFLEKFPTIRVLAEADLDDVYTVWQGLGYYSRARRLWEGAKYLIGEKAAVFPAAYEELMQVPGVGDYTAGAIASIAFGARVPAIDGNVKRVMARLLAWKKPVENTETLGTFKKQLEKWQPLEQTGDFNQALIELGATLCLPKNPACGNCPLMSFCQGYAQNCALDLPVKKQKQRQKTVSRLLFVIRFGRNLYVQKRPDQGLLAGLWEIPGVDLPPGFEDQFGKYRPEELFALYQQAVKERSYDGVVKDKLRRALPLYGPAWHVFSHRRWQMFWLLLDLGGLTGPASRLAEERSFYNGQERRFILLDRLTEIALPVAFSEILQTLV